MNRWSWPERSNGAARADPASVAADAVAPTEVGPQRLGDQDRPVRLLMRLDDGGQRPRQREPRAVQRVDELGLGAHLRSMADRHAAGLVVAEVADAADLEPALD